MRKINKQLTGKRWISILLLFSMMVSVLPGLPLSALAADSVSGTCGDGLNWSLDTGTGRLTITGSGAMDDYTYDPADNPEGRKAPWYDHLENIRTVALSKGVTSIGDGAFSGCSNLEAIGLPESLEQIGREAFVSCKALTEVLIPDNVSFIGQDAFGDCENLQAFDVNPENPAFYSWGGILFSKDETELIRYPEAKAGDYQIPFVVKKLGENAFQGCSGLTGLDMGAGIKQISEKQFIDCRNMKYVRLGVETKSIGALAFANCISLERVTNMSDVTQIGSQAFLGCTSLTEVELPYDLKNISPGLFQGCSALKTLRLPGGMRTLGSEAFSGCSALEQIEIPIFVTVIERAAFEDCSSLRNVVFPHDIKTIEDNAFSGCQSLKNFIIPENTERIGKDAFTGCWALEVLTVMSDKCEIFPSIFPSKMVIRGYRETGTESFAEEFGVPFEALSRKAGFADVLENVFYEKPVAWAVENLVTNGTGEYTFSPDQTCTRGQVVTFLWRAAGCPEPENASASFTDLKPGAFYEKAVAWAVENGITSGTSKTTFSPDATCTRGHVVTFLWRFRNMPEPKSATTPFTDLKKGAFYEKVVAWAVEEGITKGIDETRFGPDRPCTRGQVVTFLYRAVAK